MQHIRPLVKKSSQVISFGSVTAPLSSSVGLPTEDGACLPYGERGLLVQQLTVSGGVVKKLSLNSVLAFHELVVVGSRAKDAR